MADVGFYMDTAAQEEGCEEEEILTQDREVLGAPDPAPAPRRS
jgi:hypothetical protein